MRVQVDDDSGGWILICSPWTRNGISTFPWRNLLGVLFLVGSGLLVLHVSIHTYIHTYIPYVLYLPTVLLPSRQDLDLE